MSKDNKFDKIFKAFKETIPDIEFNRILGEGGFGEVREAKYQNKIYAAKVTEKNERSFYPEKLVGPNIIKIYKVFEKRIENKDYYLIIMEKALLRDLGTFCKYLHDNYSRLINRPFMEIIGNNFLKFVIMQIVRRLEILDRNELVHFDIKPENLLIQQGLNIKITDFSFLKNLQELEKGNERLKLPGGTPGYLTPEYFHSTEKVDKITAKKQDYFALGATIYVLKVGFQMLKYKKYDNDKMTEDRIIDLLQRDIAHIRSEPLMDKDFVEFLCKLIQYVPEERPSFEEIYRNKWLNKDADYISLLAYAFSDIDEHTFMKELIKSDFLMQKQREIHDNEKNRSNFKFVE